MNPTTLTDVIGCLVISFIFLTAFVGYAGVLSGKKGDDKFQWTIVIYGFCQAAMLAVAIINAINLKG